MLSDRAQKYLSTFSRQPELVCSIDELREILDLHDLPCAPAILDFHERYGGYEQPFVMGEFCRLGIAHRQPLYLSPVSNTADRLARWLRRIKVYPKWLGALGFDYYYADEADDEPGGWWVSCADTDLQMGYFIHESGEFNGRGSCGPAESFDVKIERDALLHEATTDSDWEQPDLPENVDRTSACNYLREKLGCDLVADASDRYIQTFRTADLLAYVDVDSSNFGFWTTVAEHEVYRVVRELRQ